jgi:hypothetical protein
MSQTQFTAQIGTNMMHESRIPHDNQILQLNSNFVIDPEGVKHVITIVSSDDDELSILKTVHLECASSTDEENKDLSRILEDTINKKVGDDAGVYKYFKGGSLDRKINVSGNKSINARIDSEQTKHRTKVQIQHKNIHVQKSEKIKTTNSSGKNTLTTQPYAFHSDEIPESFEVSHNRESNGLHLPTIIKVQNPSDIKLKSPCKFARQLYSSPLDTNEHSYNNKALLSSKFETPSGIKLKSSSDFSRCSSVDATEHSYDISSKSQNTSDIKLKSPYQLYRQSYSSSVDTTEHSYDNKDVLFSAESEPASIILDSNEPVASDSGCDTVSLSSDEEFNQAAIKASVDESIPIRYLNRYFNLNIVVYGQKLGGGKW